MGVCRLDDDTLVVSDGSAGLAFREVDGFGRTGGIEVRLDGELVENLNELECVAGTVWANVWQTDRIGAIDPVTGRVHTEVDVSGLPVDRTGLGVDDVCADEGRAAELSPSLMFRRQGPAALAA